MIVKKQYIPKRYRSKKLVNTGGGVAVGGSFTFGDQVDTSAFLLADKFTSLFEYDEVNDAIKAKLPLYSEGEISAYGYGGSGGGGGETGIVYNGLDSTITDIALSAYMGNVLNTTKLNVSTFNSWVSNYVPPVPSWGDITGKPSTFPASPHVHGWGEIENKPTTFAPSAHTHTWDSITSKPSVITGTTASFTTELETKLNGIESEANKFTLTKAGVESVLTGAITSHTHAYEASGTTSAAMTAHLNAFAHGNIANGQTAFGWGNHASAGYALNSALSAHIGSNGNAHGLATATTAGFMGSSHFNKLAGIESGANNYTHPTTHAPSIIVQDANNRFVTDDNIATWNAKANGTHTHYKSDIIDFAHTHNLSEIGITGLSENYLTKYNGSTLVNSQIFDNGTNVGIGATSPTEKLDVNGNLRVYDQTLTTGVTTLKVRAGAGQSSTVLVDFLNSSGSRLSSIDSAGAWRGKFQSVYNSIGMNDHATYFELGISVDPLSGMAWSNTNDDFGATKDLGISRYSAGVLAVGNGTQGSYSGTLIAGKVGIGTTTPTATLDVNGIGKFKDDIITNFKTWTKDNSKSLKSFLDKFDIDANGNLVVLGNLYSTGEVTAYSSGTGVSGLKLMGDLDANGKNINNVNSISKLDSKISFPDPTFITFSLDGYSDQFVIADDGIYANTSIAASSFYASGAVNASEFKFGNWTFKQDVSGRLGIYNGTTEVACFNTDGTYVNL